MNLLDATLLGAVEGITEFLPVSSTGHLTVVEKLLGYRIDSPDITAFTAIIQVGAILATVIFLRRDIVRLVRALFVGIAHGGRRSDPDFRMAIAVILGSIPIGVVGLLLQHVIEGPLRSLWVVGIALIVWSGPMLYADRTARQDRHEEDVTWRDTLVIGIVQCLSLVPGVSRSGATMSIGLLRGIDRVTVTRLSFLLSIPALAGAGVLQTVQEYDAIGSGVGWPATLLATAVSFVVAYAAVAWLLRFIAGHSFLVFIVYRVVAGVVVLALVGTGVLAAT